MSGALDAGDLRALVREVLRRPCCPPAPGAAPGPVPAAR